MELEISVGLLDTLSNVTKEAVLAKLAHDDVPTKVPRKSMDAVTLPNVTLLEEVKATPPPLLS